MRFFPTLPSLLPYKIPLLVLGFIGFLEMTCDATEEKILFDGSNIDHLRLDREMAFENGILTGKGKMRTAQQYTNCELRMEMRFVDRPGTILVNDLNLQFGLRVKVTQMSEPERLQQWRTWRVSFRAMEGEARQLLNLTPLEKGGPVATYRGNGGVRFDARYLSPMDGFKRNDEGYVKGSLRPLLLAFSEPVEIRRISVRPLGPLSPRPFLTMDEAAIHEGAKIYQTYCFVCHGDGIGKAPNPLARSFATDPFANGTAPHQLFATMTVGFRNMPPMANLSVAERFQVIAYMREKILKPNNPNNYFEVTDEYLEQFPEPLYSLAEQVERESQFGNLDEKKLGIFRDHGPAVVCVNELHRNAMQVKLAHDTVISYNLHDLRTVGVWHDGFMNMMGSHYYVGKGKDQPTPVGRQLPELATWRWAHGQTFDYEDDEDHGPIPYEGFRYHGHYLHNNDAILHYQVEHRTVLERPRCDLVGDLRVLRQDLQIADGEQALRLKIAKAEGESRNASGGDLFISNLSEGTVLGARLTGDVSGITIRDGIVEIPGGEGRALTVHRAVGEVAAVEAALRGNSESDPDIASLTKGSDQRRWRSVSVVAGVTVPDHGPYVLETIPVPFENDYNAWMRTTALNFMDDGRAVVTTYDGDVWIVSGIDQNLEDVTWSRFAAGLHEGFGCKVIDGLIYVGTRNGIVRLHDTNEDGEADYYEQFFADPDISLHYHGYNFDLIRDSKGYLYYAKNGQFTDIRFAGGCYKIAPDGSNWEHFGSGFRTPNGLGLLPGDRLLFGDNQGKWVPAGKISIVEKDSWYGGSGEGMDEVPNTFEQPILWLPQEVDNSCGGQLWLDDPRFGPFGKGSLFHTSCGSGRAMMIYLDEVDGVTQAATQVFPWKFDSGIMRAAINPTDGQVYVTGTRGWGVNAPKDGCLQRIRFTGKSEPVLMGVRARAGQITLTFSAPLPEETINRSEFSASTWNYLWSKDIYGSAKYSVRNPNVKEPDELTVADIQVSEDRSELVVSIPDLMPAHQVKLSYRRPGAESEDEVHLTVHRLVDSE